MDQLNDGRIRLYNEDSLTLYHSWGTPTIIISDGPYGVNGYPGDLVNTDGLGKWYEPHISKWAEYATPQTTLWFWNTELGWANVHPVLNKHGWEYKACCIWNKGMSHIAGNVNTRTLSKLPVVTEVCVQYVRRAEFNVNGSILGMKDWLRHEWRRTGLPFQKTNIACGVKDAATRKYFTNSHLWYMPPAEAFEKLVSFANQYGEPSGKPYFTIDGTHPLSGQDWQRFKAKFYCPLGLTNVWDEAQLNGKERIKIGTKAAHYNQKPLKIIESLLLMSSDENDIVWDPFGGLFTTAIACLNRKRQSFSSEINLETYSLALCRVNGVINEPVQLAFE